MEYFERKEMLYINKRHPRKLYKYFGNLDYAIKGIVNKNIHMDDPNVFNDPFDAAFFNGGVGFAGKDDRPKDGMIKFNHKITCFSEIKDSILMWAYYANCHKGVCIEYDLEKLNRDDDLNQQILRCISKVQYSPLRSDEGSGLEEDSPKDYLISKADCWSHECEWRLVYQNGPEYLPFDCISSVYLGNKYEFEKMKNIELLKIIFSLGKINVFWAKPNQFEYKLDFESYGEQ